MEISGHVIFASHVALMPETVLCGIGLEGSDSFTLCLRKGLEGCVFPRPGRLRPRERVHATLPNPYQMNRQKY